jgi:hypothetical protein
VQAVIVAKQRGQRLMGIWLFAIAALGAGSRGAWYWYLSSQITAIPTWEALGEPEPSDPVASQMGWMAGLTKAAAEAAYLNKWAAIWTAGFVALGGMASIAGALSASSN